MHLLTLISDGTVNEPGTGTLSYVALASLILGIVTPLVVSAISNPAYSKTKRQLIAIGAAIVIGFLNMIVQGIAFNWSWTFGGVIANLALVAGASQAAYAVLYHPTGVAKKLEVATSKNPAPPAPPHAA